MTAENFRSFDDFNTARRNTYAQFRDTVSKLSPVEYGGKSLSIEEVDWDAGDDEDKHPDKFDYTAQSRFRRERRTLGRRLRGTFVMRDTATGEELGRSRKLLAVVPRINEDGQFIYRGSNYVMANQQRLKSGVYGRVKKNEALEVFVNPEPGTGSVHRYEFAPETGQFSVNLRNSKIPLVPLLRVMGVKDDQIREAWGDEIAEANFQKSARGSVEKLYDRLVPDAQRVADITSEARASEIRRVISNMRLDPWTVKQTLGEEGDHLNSKFILAATRKVLAMSRGEVAGDDRDHLGFQKMHSVEDLLGEAVQLDKDRVRANALKKVLRSGDISKLPTKLLQPQIETMVFSSSLAVQPEMANPLDAWDRATRLTKLGFGAISSTDAVPIESRNLHGSQQGFVDPARTTESLRVGIDVNFTSASRKGRDGKIYTPVRDVRTGEVVYKSPEDLFDSAVAFDRRGQEVEGFVIVSRGGEMDYALPEEVDYELVDSEQGMFSGLSNLVPFKNSQPQNRTAMGTRFVAQALPMVNREAPLVRVGVPGTDGSETFEGRYSDKAGAVRSPIAGEVTEILKDRVRIASQDGAVRTVPIHAGTPLGAKTELRNEPLVRVGDRVQEGDLLAASNFTDREGNLAMGLNARVALMPWKDNYEDAYSVSESFAKRAASLHSYDFSMERNPEIRTSVNDYISALPRKFSKEQVEKLDPDGVIRVGEVVRQGDPLLLAARPKTGASSKRQVSKRAGASFRDESETWEHEDDGIVTHVHRADNGLVSVSVGAVVPLKESDKLAELAGTKGVVRIIPDDEMLQDENGQPYDVVSSDLGVISRGNSSRVNAMLLGKIAKKIGKPYVIDDMRPDINWDDFVAEELKKHDVQDRETVVDPRTGRKIPNVLTGESFIMKLHHIAESKEHARGIGSYSSEDTPAKGSEEGQQAKRVSNQELNAMMAHGGFEYIREAALLRGQRNDDYWARYINGQDLPPLKAPLVYDKYLSYLRGMGINPIRDRHKVRVGLLNDTDIEELSQGRLLENSDTVDLNRDLKPMKGGLFDERLFGEFGDKYAKYALSEPLPHPLMEDAFRKLMGVTKAEYRDILAGKVNYKDFGAGPEGIANWLGALDPKKELAIARRQAQDARKTKREEAIKRVKYLRGLVDREIDPKSLMLQSVLIIPPAYRPITKLEGKDTPLIDGMNLLYRDMIETDKAMQRTKKFTDDISQERLTLYDAVQAAAGLRQPLDPELRQKQVTGLMARLVGRGGPKTSYAQRKLLSGTVDFVGRGVATPSTELTLNEIGIPESQAWNVFKLPVLRNLRKRGFPLATAMQLVEEKSQQAREALQQEVDTRPVVMSRAPVLHKYGKLAFNAKIVDGKSIKVNPLVHAGYNLDHDGNCIDHDTRIALEFSWSVLYATEAGRSFLSKLQEVCGMRLLADAKLAVSGAFRLVLRIGDLPKMSVITEKENQVVYSLPHGVKVLTYAHGESGALWVDVTSLTVEQGHRTVKVTYSNGSEVIVSDNESLAVFDADTAELVRRCPEYGEALYTPYLKRVPLPVITGTEASFDDGWLYGAMLANGWKTDNMVGYSKSDAVLRNKVEELCRKLTINFASYTYEDAKSASKFSDSAKIHMNGRELPKLIPDMIHTDISRYGKDTTWVEPRKGLYPWSTARIRPALFKYICPNAVRNFGREAWVGLICGYLENDGTLLRQEKKNRTKGFLDRVRINTSSPYLLEDLQLALRYLGIRVSIAKKAATESSHPGYGLEFSLCDTWDLASEMRFYSQAAQAWLQSFKSSERPTDRRDQIPVPKVILKLIDGMVGKDGSTIRAAIKKSGWLSRSLCRSVIREFSASALQDPVFRRWVSMVENTDIYWYRVTSVVEHSVSATVYDLEVPDTKVFAINSGMVIYDTLNFHALITPEAIEEAKQKLMPTSSLVSPVDFKSPMFVPRQDHALGIYLASKLKDENARPQVFANKTAMYNALARGEITAATPVRILQNE